jgi:hypothetical protein
LNTAAPLGMLGAPEEVAQAAAFPISPKASFITGTYLVGDGRSDQSACLNRRQTTPGAAGPGDIEQMPHFRPTHRPPFFGALANSVTAHGESHGVGNRENRADTTAIDPLYLFDRLCGPVWKGRLSSE